MIVGIAAWTVPPLRYGGMSTFVEHLAFAYRRMGHDVVLIGFGPQREGCWEWNGIRVCNFTCPNPNPPCLDFFWRRLEAPVVDALILNDYHVMGLARHDIPSLIYFHALAAAPMEIVGIAYAKAIVANSNKMMGVVRPFVDVVVNLLNGWRQQLGLDEPVRNVVYPAPPEPQGKIAEHALVERLHARGYSVISVLARLQDEVKNPQLAVEAAKILARRGRRVALVVAGHGREGGSICSCGGVPVYQLGSVSEEEKWSLLASSDVLILPSKFEPFGLVALEAVRVGTPAVLSKNSGVSEVLPAPMFDPERPDEAAEALEEALDDPEGLLRKQQTAWIMTRSWLDVARELIQPLL